MTEAKIEASDEAESMIEFARDHLGVDLEPWQEQAIRGLFGKPSACGKQSKNEAVAGCALASAHSVSTSPRWSMSGSMK